MSPADLEEELAVMQARPWPAGARSRRGPRARRDGGETATKFCAGSNGPAPVSLPCSASRRRATNRAGLMAVAIVTIAGRSYRLGCDEGQEKRLEELAASVDGKSRRCAAVSARSATSAWSRLAAIEIADEAADARAKSRRWRRRSPRCGKRSTPAERRDAAIETRPSQKLPTPPRQGWNGWPSNWRAILGSRTACCNAEAVRWDRWSGREAKAGGHLAADPRQLNAPTWAYSPCAASCGSVRPSAARTDRRTPPFAGRASARPASSAPAAEDRPRRNAQAAALKVATSRAGSMPGDNCAKTERDLTVRPNDCHRRRRRGARRSRRRGDRSVRELDDVIARSHVRFRFRVS